MQKQTLVLASGNNHKVKEVREILADKFWVKNLSDLQITDFAPEENGETFEANALIKAQALYNRIKSAVFSDDSGLVVPSLNGQPGVRSARYAGQQATDRENYELLLKKLDRTETEAYFQCVVCLYLNPDEYYFYEGKCKGKIIGSPMGNGGFGYDPIFVPKGYQKTLAQMSSEEKNKISHRYFALQKIREFYRK